MVSFRRKLTAAAVACLLVLAAAAQAGLMPPDIKVIEGAIAAFDIQSGRLEMAGRTLYLTPQSAVQQRVGDRLEAVDWTRLYPGQEAKAVVSLKDGHYVVRSLELKDIGAKPTK